MNNMPQEMLNNITSGVLHEMLLYKSEELLLDALYKKDFEAMKYLWEIISTYIPIVQSERNKITIAKN